MKKINRRDALKASIFAGLTGATFSSTPFTPSQATQIDPELAFDGASIFGRRYTALNSSGNPTHSIGLQISTPVSQTGVLDDDCWSSRIALSNLLPNTATGFIGGNIVEVIQAQDSIASFLMAAERARELLSLSAEAQSGSVVVSFNPDLSNYALPTAVPALPSTQQAPPRVATRQKPTATDNPRIVYPSGSLGQISLIRDLERCVDGQIATKIRIVVGHPQENQGPAPNLVSYTSTIQITGLQVAPGATWNDGIVTHTAHGSDPLDALICALSHALIKLKASAEGQQGGIIHWPLSPTDATYGLPRMDLPSTVPADKMVQFLNTLPAEERAELQEILDNDWSDFFS